MDADKKKALPQIVSSNVKIHKKDENSTVFRVLGVPYYGPEYLGFKDLHGEFFSKATDFAFVEGKREPIVPVALSYYDHAYNDNVGTDPIGVAKFVEETDAGQIWDIEIMRAYRYLDMLELMASKNLLGASSQPIQTAVDIDWNTGWIKKWPVAEMSLTPTPANPDAVAEVVKSFGLPPKMEKKNVDNEEKNQVDVVKEPTTETTTTETPSAEATSTPSLENEINEMFETEEPVVELETAKTIVELLTEVKSLSAQVKTLSETVAAMSTTVDAKFEAVTDGVTNVRTGLKALAQNVAKQVRFEVSDELDRKSKQSEVEREAEREVRQTPSTPFKMSYLPDNAPGQRKAVS